jgi:hypothetical protein
MQNNFSPNSRVWVYQSDRNLNESETEEVQKKVDFFTQDWTAHNQMLKAKGEIIKGRFLVLIVDETQAGASGCSIDKSVRFVQQLGENLETDFFNRLIFSFIDEKNNIQSVGKQQLKAFFAENKINENTLIFDTLVSNYADFQNGFTKTLGESWMRKMV